MDIYIVEDDFFHLHDIKITLEELGHEVCGTSADALTILEEVEKFAPDLIVMDIHLNGKQEGIALAKRIKNSIDVEIIFSSSDISTATMTEAIDTNPISYITKPVNKSDLQAALILANKKIEEKNNQDVSSVNSKEIYVKSNNALVKVLFSEILFAFADTKNYITLQLDGDKKVVIRSSIASMSKLLSQDFFVQTHRAYIVNWNKVSAISEANQEVMVQNHAIPLGRTFKELVYKKLTII
jgi:two-component system, LytTR family, response regulator LytT